MTQRVKRRERKRRQRERELEEAKFILADFPQETDLDRRLKRGILLFKEIREKLDREEAVRKAG